MDTQIPNDLRVVVHDLNNILNIVLNGVELLKENISKEENSGKLLEHIENNTLLASKLIHQISSKNIKEYDAQIDLIAIIEDSVKDFTDSYSGRISFNVKKDGKFIIKGNVVDIRRMLLNLFTNSKEANCTEIELEIKLDKNNKYIKLSVSDNGNGISEDFVDKIFGLGFTTKNKDIESGMGLAFVKAVMENHSGWIELNMNTDGGTTFDLFFPYTSISKNITRLEKKRVLIAEDDVFQREVLSDLLKSLKINVFTASNGNEALDIYYSEKPDLLFIDESMPGLTGIQCSAEIRKVDKESPIVLLTGATLEEKEMNHISKLLKKPYNFESIRSTLLELL